MLPVHEEYSLNLTIGRLGGAFMMMDARSHPMPEKIALVTGVKGGLGTHVIKTLLDAGFAVVGLSPKIQQSDFDHPNFSALPASLDSLDAAKKAADTVIARFGKMHVLASLAAGCAGGLTG